LTSENKILLQNENMGNTDFQDQIKESTMVSISGKVSNQFHQLIATRREPMGLKAIIGNIDW
jgi:hypothetical protein